MQRELPATNRPKSADCQDRLISIPHTSSQYVRHSLTFWERNIELSHILRIRATTTPNVCNRRIIYTLLILMPYYYSVNLPLILKVFSVFLINVPCLYECVTLQSIDSLQLESQNVFLFHGYYDAIEAYL